MWRNTEEYKELKKVRWVSWEVFREILEREPKESFVEEKPQINKDVIPHASINRLTMTTVGGELYNEEALWLSSFGIIVKFFDESFAPLVKACLKFSQLGGNKTTGMGRYRLEETEPPEGMEEFISQKSTRAFLISDCFYDPEFDLKKQLLRHKGAKTSGRKRFDKEGLEKHLLLSYARLPSAGKNSQGLVWRHKGSVKGG